MKSVFSAIITLLCIYSQAQNIVLNPGFEGPTACPVGGGQIMFAQPWESRYGSPDLFNECDTANNYGIPFNMYGFENERTFGRGYAGLVTYDENGYREIIQGESPGPIFPGTHYYVTAWASWSDNQPIRCLNLGMNFPVNPNDTVKFGFPAMEFDMVSMEQVDSAGWTKISGKFELDYQGQYFRIGNFRKNADSDTLWQFHPDGGRQTAYLLIDDICISVGSIDCGFPVGIEEPAPVREMLWEFDGVFWQPVDRRRPGKMYKVLESKY